MPKIGKCALCLIEGKQLRDSHYVPAGVYRVLRDESAEDGNPNPILLGERAAIQTSKQITDYLLCPECEDRLNRNGENYFLKICWRRNGFKLHAILDATPPSLLFPRIKVYAAANFPEINVQAISYFAASMFWRASVHDWNGRGDEQIQLGPYEQQFRKYLMAESDFPVDCALWVSVPDTITPFTPSSFIPYGGRINGMWQYTSFILGVGFQLYVGNGVSQAHRELCFVRGKGHPIVKSDLQEQGILNAVLDKYRSHPDFAAAK
jgi:hypothetical protein